MRSIELSLHDPHDGTHKFIAWRDEREVAYGDVIKLKAYLDALGGDRVDIIYVRDRNVPKLTRCDTLLTDQPAPKSGLKTRRNHYDTSPAYAAQTPT